MTHAVRVAAYRLRRTVRRRWAGYLSVVVLVSLTGGLAMASLAGARRTQSSYQVFLASTNPSTLSMSVYYSAGPGDAGPSLKGKIARLGDVAHVRTVVVPPIAPLDAKGHPRLNTLSSVVALGSLDGLLSRQDRPALVSGRLANPARVNEIELTSGAARIWGVHAGQTVRLGIFRLTQSSPTGPQTMTQVDTVTATVTGIIAFNDELITDDIDSAYGFAVTTPALVRLAQSFLTDPLPPVSYSIQLRHGDRGLAAVEHRLIDVVPRHYTYEFHLTSRSTATVNLAIRPESVALGAFGAIAALVCVILASQALSRQLRRGAEDRRILRSVGASPSDTFADATAGAVGAVVLGALGAVAVALALSPLFPIGPVRPFYPDAGVSVDGPVLVIGTGLLVALLGSVVVATALRDAPHRASRRSSGPAPSGLARRARSLGLPVVGALGVHFALEPGHGRREAPVRSILLGAVLAVTLVVATLTFASGLTTLIEHPSLYGWNWSYMLNPTNNVPPQALTALRRDPLVAAWSGADYTDVQIDGITVPVLLERPGARVTPPILSGHAIANDHQVVLGAATLALLHRRVGQTVTVSYASKVDAPIYIPPTRLTIVGTATFPAVGYVSTVAEHTSMGTGALLSPGIEPPAFAAALRSPDPTQNGPNLVFVRLRRGVAGARGLADLERVAHVANAAFASDPNGNGYSVGVVGVQRPAQIVNYRSIGSTPLILAAGLALGAIAALGLTLVASVRSRRRDLALLKTFGMTRGQVSATIAWQATVDGVVGAALGVPAGVVIGRQLWTWFATSINAVPHPTVPVLAVALVGAGAVMVANVAAALPGRSAARTPAGLVMRAE